MNTSNLFEQLKNVRWSPSSVTSVLLTELGVEHGFVGIDADLDIARLMPNHVKQVHGIAVIAAGENTKFDQAVRPEADGLFTTGTFPIAVKTADCLPVLMSDDKGEWVAAIHAGWRGFTKGILLNALTTAEKHGYGEKLHIAIGPAISRERFEVGPDVVDALQSFTCGLDGHAWALAVSKGANDRWHVDLPLAAAAQLILAGVDPRRIEVIQGCTRSDVRDGRHLWNSYRRDGQAMKSNWAYISCKHPR